MQKISLIFVFYLCIINATLSPSKSNKKTKNKEKEIIPKSGPQNYNVFDRNLVEDQEPFAKDIVLENGAYCKDTAKRFNGTILAYVTPWNSHGYDVAKIFGPKFNIISPVWLQILRDGEKNYVVGGLHDIDADWVKDVRKAGKQLTKILPRILFEKFTDQDFSHLLTYPDQIKIVAKLIVDLCKKYKFNGIVLEVWSQLSARVDDTPLSLLVTEISNSLRNAHLELILVIPPMRKETVDLFTKNHFDTLYPFVDGFSLMTYDFSNIQRPGANSPLYWIRKSIESICPESTENFMEKRKKILMGMNLYGNDYTPDGGKAIIGHEFLSLVKHVKTRLQFDEHDVENFFEVKTSNGRHIVFYPTLYSINERLKLATELGTGVSLWEIGQGLDYFYDLF